jgi:hypothetical protein
MNGEAFPREQSRNRATSAIPMVVISGEYAPDLRRVVRPVKENGANSAQSDQVPLPEALFRLAEQEDPRSGKQGSDTAEDSRTRQKR